MARLSGSWWRDRNVNFPYSLIETFVFEAFVRKAGLCCNNTWTPNPHVLQQQKFVIQYTVGQLWLYCHLPFRIQTDGTISSQNIANHHVRRKRDQASTCNCHVLFIYISLTRASHITKTNVNGAVQQNSSLRSSSKYC